VSHAYRQIGAASVARVVSPIGEVPRESQARELVPLKGDPDLLREVWQAVIDSGKCLRGRIEHRSWQMSLTAGSLGRGLSVDLGTKHPPAPWRSQYAVTRTHRPRGEGHP
jgi:hypothetical protein